MELMRAIKTEIEMNKLLPEEAIEITKMVYYKEDQMTEPLVLNNGKEIYHPSSYIYVVFPLQGPSLLDVL